jgi:hypothetical protein
MEADRCQPRAADADLEPLAELVGVDGGAVRFGEHQVLVAVVGADRQAVTADRSYGQATVDQDLHA